MGRINAVISDDVEEAFRLAVIKKYGRKKGGLSYALEESLKYWLKKQTELK